MPNIILSFGRAGQAQYLVYKVQNNICQGTSGFHYFAQKCENVV